MSGSSAIVGMFLAVVAVCVGCGGVSAGEEAGDGALRARRFLENYEKTVRPQEIEVGRRWWAANVSGKDEDYQKKQEAETKLELMLADPKAFAELKAIHSSTLSDAALARQIDVLYLDYLARQIDPELLKQIMAKANAVEQAFNVYRPKVDGKELTDNEVRRVLRESKDSVQRAHVVGGEQGSRPQGRGAT